jgi:hypothetical protein
LEFLLTFVPFVVLEHVHEVSLLCDGDLHFVDFPLFCGDVEGSIKKIKIIVEVLGAEARLGEHFGGELPSGLHHELEHLAVGVTLKQELVAVQLK